MSDDRDADELRPNGPPSSDRATPPVITSHAAYFFIPLPDALALPDQLTRGIVDTTAVERVANEGLPLEHLSVSIRFHTASRASTDAQTILMLFAIAGKALPDHDGERNGAGQPSDSAAQPPLQPVTVAEVMVPLDFPSTSAGPADEEEVAALSDAFDKGLHSLRQIQRAYYLARREPIRLASRESLPFAVPLGLRRLDRDTAESFAVTTSLYFVNANAAAAVGGEGWTDEDNRAMDTAIRFRLDEGVFATSMDFMREATVALVKTGDYRSAVIFSATACEVLFDDLLAHLQWEEGERPEDAAVAFDSLLSKRVKNQFHQRLGGVWSLDSPGPIREWFTKVAGIRNRAVHSGLEPSLQQARDALETAEQLLTHLGDLVASRATTYPRTALVLPGEFGLRRRGKWDPVLESLAHDDLEVPWRDTFRRWRAAMQRERTDSAIATDASLDRARILLVIHPDHSERWVAHDAASGMAASIRSDSVILNAEQASQIDFLRGHVANLAPTEAISIQVEDAALAPTIEIVWIAEYRLVPQAGVQVDGRDFDPA